MREEGYERGVNIHGAPYDFRKAANEHGEYFTQLEDLVERTFSDNGDTSVMLVSYCLSS